MSAKAKKKEVAKATKVEKSEKGEKKALFAMGVPDSEYLVFEDRNLNSFMSAMLATPGLMKGKIIDLAAKSDVGKTAFSGLILGTAQRQNEQIFWCDAERSATKEFLTLLNIDTKKLMLSKPYSGEEAMASIKEMVKAGGRVGVLDSTTACVPESELESKSGAMATQARMMGQEMRKVDKVIADASANLITISQIKEKPGVSFGNPEYVSSGGSAVGYHARIRLTARRVEQKVDEATRQILHYHVRFSVGKNHTGFKRTSPFDLVVNNRFEPIWDETALHWAKQFKLVDRDNKTICGIEYKGRGTDADLRAAIAGKEHLVFDEADAQMKANEAAGVVFEEQDDTTDSLAADIAKTEESI